MLTSHPRETLDILTILISFNPKIKLAPNMIVGSDFEVFAVLTNNCMEARTCSFVFFAKAISYNGKLGESCGFASEKVEVPPGEGQQTDTRLC